MTVFDFGNLDSHNLKKLQNNINELQRIQDQLTRHESYYSDHQEVMIPFGACIIGALILVGIAYKILCSVSMADAVIASSALSRSPSTYSQKSREGQPYLSNININIGNQQNGPEKLYLELQSLIMATQFLPRNVNFDKTRSADNICKVNRARTPFPLDNSSTRQLSGSLKMTDVKTGGNLVKSLSNKSITSLKSQASDSAITLATLAIGSMKSITGHRPSAPPRPPNPPRCSILRKPRTPRSRSLQDKQLRGDVGV